MTKRYVSYLRDSGGPDQETSTNQQAAEVESLAQQEGHIITRTFRDRAQSGSTTVGRDQFLAMIEYLENPANTEAGVILWSYSRFARNYDDAQFYLATLRRAGREVISVTDDIPEGLDGRLMESLVAWQNAKFLETLSRDVKRGLAYTAQEYRGWIGGPAPLGYKLVPKQVDAGRTISQLVPDPVSVPLVRDAFQARARGEPLKTVAQGLGLTVPGSGHLLRNQIYIGVFVSQNGYRVGGFCEPLISQSLWDQVQRVNDSNFHPRTKAREYILSHILTCGHCGGKMWGHTSEQTEYYRCRNRVTHTLECPARGIRKHSVERVALDAISDYLSDSVHVEKIYNQFVGDSKPVDIAALERELKSTQTRIRRVTAAIADAGHSAALLESLAGLEQTRDNLTVQIRQADEQLPASLDEVLARSRELLADLESASPAQQRLIVSETIQYISAKLDDGGLDVDVVFRAVCMGR